jgi:type II secretory pathway pseudopilin PulG
VELIVVVSLAAILAALAVPSLRRTSSGLRVRMAAGELAGVMRTARSLAVRHSAKVGVKFRPTVEGGWSFTIYRDGDGDGVLSRDIDSGVDPQVAPPRNLIHMGRDVTFGFPPGSAPRDPGDPRRRISNLGDPIRFNRSDLASFSSLGGSTPGSLYLTDNTYHLAVVRVFGRTGKVKVMSYDPQTEIWR